ncbi:Astacin (Peptidase family M12A) [compost metagenome]
MNSISSCTLKRSVGTIASYEAATLENPDNSISQPTRRQTRSVASHSKYWKAGRTLSIAILPFDDDIYNTIKNAINQWAPYVNLNFEFMELSDNNELYEGDIRIDVSPFHNHLASSDLGTDALLTPADETTMKLGTNHTSAGYAAIVMHEFGHALGLEHEHQHPDANIPWDRDKTYLWFQRFGMSREMIDAQVFPLDRNPDLTYATYDRHSIMHYEVRNECTIGEWYQPNNTQLSAGDIAFARRIYP